ncbi:MAG: Mur ligase domain-containing protein, partial [Bacteroidia bacterium]|nr:Mur ligase domain-containing protein [Bacteroidia bacterium]
MHIHIIAIAGSIMHNLALALQAEGHRVSGSDDVIREPSKSRLLTANLLPESEGWFPDKISSQLDCVIVGMHAKPDNPELKKAKELKLPVYSFPQFLYEHAKNKQRIAICGSHGKTTITAIILHVLKGLSIPFDYAVGAQVPGFDCMVKLSDDAPILIVEGDEYPTSPEDSRPKFLVYQPHIIAISGIAWDHFNVYPTEESYVYAFERLLKQLPKAGFCVYNDEDKTLLQIVKKYIDPEKHYLHPYETPFYKYRGSLTELKMAGEKGVTMLFGAHNLSNIAAAWNVCKLLAIEPQEFLAQLATFRGASMRLETIYQSDSLTIIRDFAHSPSKVQASVQAVLERFDKKNVIAVLELHTFSSLNKEFLHQYKKTLKPIKRKIVLVDENVLKQKSIPILSKEDIWTAFDDKEIWVVTNALDLQHTIQKNLTTKSVLLLMSSGNLAGFDWTSIIPT